MGLEIESEMISMNRFDIDGMCVCWFVGKCTNAKQNRLTRFDNALIIPQESLCYPRARLSSLVVVISSLVMEVRSRQTVAAFLGGGGQ